ICSGGSYAFGSRTLTAAGIYRDTLANATGCDSIVVLTLNVKNNPVISISASGPLAFCQGGTVQLTASGGISYLWSNGLTTPTISVNVGGNYVVTGTGSNGCTSNQSLSVIVYPGAIIPVIVAMGPTVVCKGIVTLTSSVVPSYLWSNGDTSQSITVNQSGNYSVTSIDQNGCQGTSNTIRVDVNQAVPSRPIAITGDLNPCVVLGTNNTLTYSVPFDSNVISYNWILTNGITAVGNANGNVISVTYPAGFTTGQIRVIPSNACGNGLARAIYPKTTSISTLPLFVHGTSSVCDVKGTGAQIMYAIQPIPGCSSYQWTLPTNATLVSGQ
ncbi:MAG: hypothetical protein ACOVOL_03260, partial [Bacteroidia bacterium]